jgi:hypothetical protein
MTNASGRAKAAQADAALRGFNFDSDYGRRLFA